MTAPSAGIHGGALRRTLAPLLVVELFAGVLQAYFAPLYPSLAARFRVDTATASWALIVFTLSTAVFTPLFTRLGDVHGHRRILCVVTGLVAAGCVLIAVAPSFGVLLAGRFLQGMFPSYLPLMFGLVRARVPGEGMRRGIAYLSGALFLGGLAGTMATGLLAHATGGPLWALWLPAVGTALGFSLLWLIPPDSRDMPVEARVNWPVLALLGAGLACALLGVSRGHHWGWASGATLGLLGAGGATLAAWAAAELRAAQPMIDLRLMFRGRLLLICVVAIGAYSAAIGTQVVNSTFLALPRDTVGYGIGLGTLAISAALTPGIGLAAGAAVLTARLGRSIGYPATMAIGAVVVVLGFAALMLRHGNLPEFLIGYAVSCVGMGLVGGTTRTIVVDSIRPGETSTGSGVYELAVTLGGAIGAAVITAVVAASTSPRTHVVTEAGFRTAWATAALFALAAAVAAMTFVIRFGRRSDSDTRQPGPFVEPGTTAEPAGA